MSLFSSFLVLLLILVEAAPSSASSVPKLGIYYCFNMVIIMMSIFLSSVVVNIHRAGRSVKRLPYIVRLIFLSFLGRLCLVKPCGIPTRLLRHLKGHSVDRTQVTDENLTLLNCNGEQDSMANNYQKISSSNHIQASSQGGGVEYLLQENITKVSELKDFVKKLLDYITRKERVSRERLESAKEWQQLAKIVDRLLFVLYLFAIIISLVYQFPRPPFMNQWQFWNNALT